MQIVWTLLWTDTCTCNLQLSFEIHSMNIHWIHGNLIFMNIITHIDIPSSHLLYPYARHFIPLDTKICMVLRNLNLYQEVVYNIFKKSLPGICFLLTIITLFGTPYVILSNTVSTIWKFYFILVMLQIVAMDIFTCGS